MTRLDSKSFDKSDSSVAILFVHGILGNREFFNFLLPFVPSAWTVVNLLLKGHGGSVSDFGNASMSEWKKQVREAVAGLRQQHRRVLIVAHSMGTLFAIRESVEGNADGLFLLNTPLKIRLTRRLFETPVKIFRGKISENDVWTQAVLDSYGVEHDPNIFHYFGWIPRYIELFREIRAVRRLCPDLNVCAEAFLSAYDEMVSPESSKFLKCSSSVVLNILDSSGHYYYTDNDRAFIVERFKNFIRE